MKNAKNFQLPYQVILFGFTEVKGTTQTTIASGTTMEECLNRFTKFLQVQPLHHFGITPKSVIKMWTIDAGFIFDLPMIETI